MLVGLMHRLEMLFQLDKVMLLTIGIWPGSVYLFFQSKFHAFGGFGNKRSSPMVANYLLSEIVIGLYMVQA
jgi:hypothetical protein